MNLIGDDTVDLVATHPPYAGIIAYSKGMPVAGDLSQIRSIEGFLSATEQVARECYRVLKPNKHCAILIGDTRRYKHYIPIAYRVMERFLAVGFILREDIIKVQWNMKSTRDRWSKGTNRDFMLIYHEHLFVFRKPDTNEDIRKFKESMQNGQSTTTG